MSVTIFTITHKQFTPPADPMYVPLHVGRINGPDLGFIGDDTGDHISWKNSSYCELTGIYWIWKNFHKASFLSDDAAQTSGTLGPVSTTDYVGICHYRRYLINDKGVLFTEDELTHLLSRYDMLTTKLLTLPGSYYKGFCTNHHQKDLEITSAVIKELYPEYLDTFEYLLHGSNTYFGNILITSKKEFDRYCTWLFSILFEVEKRTDLTGYNGYQKRLFGFLSEFLQTVWIKYHNLSVKECMVGMVGEKYETRLLKEQLADFFKKRDYEGAQKHFMDCYNKRPDILMEASDVNGELRLCMQIISTCKFEDQMYKKCILDSLKDYPSLIQHFERLNTAVVHSINHCTTKEDSVFLEQNTLVTPISIEIAVKILTGS